MKKVFIYLVLAVSALNAFSQTEVKLVKWYTIEEAMKLNEKTPKKIFIDVYTDWCGWCKTMDKNTFNNPVIAEYLNNNFYPVKLNAEQKEDITYKDKVFKNRGTESRSPHDFAAALLQGKMSYPSVVYLDGENNPITAVSGYYPPEEMEPILVFFGEDHYKTTQWPDFKAKFVSKLQK